MHGPHIHSGMAGMKKAAFEVALKGKRQVADGTMEFIFQKPAGFTFRAGQHLRMTIPNLSESIEGGNKRFMTLANTPQDVDLVLAMRMTGSAFKNTLNEMQVGQKALIEILLGVPHGAFALHDDQRIPAVFIAGGIGIIPAYSMVKDWEQRKLTHKLALFYSNRRPEDAPYLSELEELSKRNPSFRLVATMTEPEKSSMQWHGETGFISEEMLKKHIPDFSKPTYYISGMAEMVDAMKALIVRLGGKEENIKAEEFSGFKMGEHEGMATPWKKHLWYGVAALVLLTVGIVHAGVISTLRDSGALTLRNPYLLAMLGVMLALILFKFRYFSKLHRSVIKNFH